MEAIKNFCQSTSIHGISHAFKPSHKILKVFWTVIVLAAFSGLSLHLYYLLDSYLQYKSTESSYEERDGYQFPDVTICNSNGISASNLREAAKSNPKLQELYKTTDNVSYVNTMPANPGFLIWALGDKFHTIGHQFHDMIVKCSYQEDPCEKDDFELFKFPAFFNCYTFKRGRSSNLTLVNGFGNSLSLTLYLEPEEPETIQDYDYLTLFANNKGFRILITPPNFIAAIGNAGFEITPGYSTSVGFDITKHIRLPEPYSECRKAESMKLEGDVPYSFVECRNMCVHKLVIEECGCFPTRYITRNNNNVNSCGHYIFTNQTKSDELLKCQEEMLLGIQSRVDFGSKCNCHWPCEDTTYSTYTSYSIWPIRKSLDSFIKNILEDHPRRDELKAYQHYQKLKQANATKDEIYAWVNQHFVRLNVYANTNIVSVEEQVPMYSSTDLLCQIGGCLGLWVGMSCITIVEVFDLGIKILASVFSDTKPVKTDVGNGKTDLKN